MHNWESELGLLYINRRIPLNEFFSGKTTKEHVLKKMSEKHFLTPDIQYNINEMYKELESLSVIPVVSVLTPLKGVLGGKFNLIFNHQNLEKIEDADIIIKYGLFWGYYVTEFPTGSHCVLMISNNIDSKLLEGLEESENGGIRIGLCNKDNWHQIKNELQESKKEFQEWRDKNVT